MTNATSTRVVESVDTYLASLSEPDSAARGQLIAQAWVADGRYVDPQSDHRGASAMEAAISGLQSQYPGFTFRRSSGVDAHHEYLRFAWEFVGPDGTVALTGLDIGSVGEDGKLAGILGFFGDLPAA